MSEVGQRFGPYACVRRLGGGGMAETFVGRRLGQAGFEQRVCLKVMRSAGAATSDRTRMFLREAATAALLRHGNIVQLVDVVEGHAGPPALVFELVEGADLAAILRRAPGRALSQEVVVWVGIELAKALAYAHGRTFRGQPHGIVHRDISPANVMVSYAGEVKLADFGIAKVITPDGEMASRVHGKLGYMAPEQAAGQPVDARADLFSLGVLLFEAISGQRPFDGHGEHETLRRAAHGEHASLATLAPSTPSGLARLIESLISPRPGQRPPSAEAVLDALVPFAPSPATFRLLGQMAQQARPHDTLLTDALLGQPDDGADPGSASGLAMQEEPVVGGVGGTMPMTEYRAQQQPPASTHLKWWLLGLTFVALAAFASLLWISR